MNSNHDREEQAMTTNDYDPNEKTVAALTEVTSVDAIYERGHVHVQGAKINLPDDELDPSLNGNRGVVIVSPCGVDTLALTPTAARSVAAAILDAADAADFYENGGLGTAILDSILRAGDPGEDFEDVDDEGVVMGNTFEFVDHDGDSLMLSRPGMTHADVVVFTAVENNPDFDEDEESPSISVAVTREQANTLIRLLVDFVDGDE